MKKIITEERSFEKMFPLPARDMPTINKRTIMANLTANENYKFQRNQCYFAVTWLYKD